MFNFFTTTYRFLADSQDVVNGNSIQFKMDFEENTGITFEKKNVTESEWLILLNRSQKYFTVYGE